MSDERSYPLFWPDGWPRTDPARRIAGVFKATFWPALQDLRRELARMNAGGVTVSTNIALRQDGLPYADQARRRVADPGVALYFAWRKRPMAMACDQYDTVAANVRAVGLTIAALRGVERWGASELLERAFRGFAALPNPDRGKPWWAVLGLQADASWNDVSRRYRELSLLHHPDRAGDAARMSELNAAMAEARSEFARQHVG